MSSDPLETDWGNDSNVNVSRRRVLAGVGGLAIGGVGLSVGMSGAGAAVSLNSWDVQDQTFEAESVTPVVNATVAYDYDAAGVSTLWMALTVSGDVVDETGKMVSSDSGSGEESLSGGVLESSAFTQSDFEVGAGGTTTVDVPVGAAFEVRDSAGNVLASDSVEQTAVVKVVHPEDGVATVGGSAVIEQG